ncbi:MAG: polysaccharide biosynthesis/export family protein [Gemmatimonadetes bacterium]|nr:polysaccharide biosynthesis/export family protein [Gemmatimonadota bacterium]
MLALLLSASSLALAQSKSMPALEAEPGGEYLRAGDVIKLVVWREPDMTGEFPVHDNGVAVLPRVGAYDVTRETAASLKARLVEELETYLRDPVVDVIVLRRVKILGAVHRPGLYSLDLTMSLGDGLALAGGATGVGRRDRIEILRDGERIVAELNERTRITDSPLRSGDEVYVPERSWLARNYGVAVSIMTTGVGIMLAIILNKN